MQIEQRYVLVPVEPTEAMTQAAVDLIDRNQGPASQYDCFRAYRAMIAARPADSDMVKRVQDMLVAAYKAGATAVHNSWVEGTNGSEPDFYEAASDYARAAIAAMGSADETRRAGLRAMVAMDEELDREHPGWMTGSADMGKGGEG